jgi:hypothetical protein
MKQLSYFLVIFFTLVLLASCSKEDANELEIGSAYGKAPDLGYFSPSEGRIGTYVIIEGENFSTNLEKNKIYFNGVQANLYEGSDTIIVAIVPEKALTGKISIVVDGMTDTTSRDFTVSDNPWLRKYGLSWGRNEAVATAIGDYGYCGLGSSVSSYFNDWWKYDRIHNNWEKVAEFEGEARDMAIAFTIGNKAYVGLGHIDGIDNNTPADIWEYSSDTDTWKQLGDFPGGGRTDAVAFSCNGKGYVGSGLRYSADSYKGFWEYEPETDSWSQLSDYPGKGDMKMAGFVIGSSIYMGCGYSWGTGAVNDFWKYDTTTKSWSKIADFAGGARVDAVGFAINGYGYFGTGSLSSYAEGEKDFWKYDPSTDKWTKVTDFFGGYVPSIGWEDGTRSEAVSFVLDNYAYVGTGQGVIHSRGDIWEYKPE